MLNLIATAGFLVTFNLLEDNIFAEQIFRYLRNQAPVTIISAFFTNIKLYWNI